MIDWHYTKDKSIPLDGSFVWVATHNNETGKNKVMKVRCDISNIFLQSVLLLTNDSVAYAWAPFDSFYEFDLIPAPVYKGE